MMNDSSSIFENKLPQSFLPETVCFLADFELSFMAPTSSCCGNLFKFIHVSHAAYGNYAWGVSQCYGYTTGVFRNLDGMIINTV